jgi:hypothetical protein
MFRFKVIIGRQFWHLWADSPEEALELAWLKFRAETTVRVEPA